MKHKLIIDGNAVYELDLKCAAKKAGKKTVKTNKDKNRETKKFRPGLNQPEFFGRISSSHLRIHCHSHNRCWIRFQIRHSRITEG